jgi:hypothetical protein
MWPAAIRRLERDQFVEGRLFEGVDGRPALLEAKQCYILRMPVACIAQAGLVGEMVALWRFRMLQPTIDGRPSSEDLQKLILGREFDKLGQEERVRVRRAHSTCSGPERVERVLDRLYVSVCGRSRTRLPMPART